MWVQLFDAKNSGKVLLRMIFGTICVVFFVLSELPDDMDRLAVSSHAVDHVIAKLEMGLPRNTLRATFSGFISCVFSFNVLCVLRGQSRCNLCTVDEKVVAEKIIFDADCGWADLPSTLGVQ